MKVYVLWTIYTISHFTNCLGDYVDAWTGHNSPDRSKRDTQLNGYHFNILLQQIEPYVMVNDSLQGNDRYEGYIPAIIRYMAEENDFTFTFGHRKSDEWISTEEFAVQTHYNMLASTTAITSARQKVVNFIQPFAHVNLRVIIQHPHIRRARERQERHHKSHKTGVHKHPFQWDYNFNVFEPFTPEVWGTASLFVVIVWLFLWLMNRYNPYEHGYRYRHGLQRADKDNAKLFDIAGSFWFVISTLQWQGYDRRPTSYASRVVCCFWMLFVLFTLVSYIASSVNHMFWADAVRRHTHLADRPFADFIDVINRVDGYEYGCLRGGSTYQYLTNSTGKVAGFEKIKEYFESASGQTNLVDSMEEGFERARNSKYAFIVENTFAKYELSQAPCDLVDTGISIGMRSYGFALRKDLSADILNALNQATLSVIENGVLEKLDDWFSPADAMCRLQDDWSRDARYHREWRLQNPGRLTFADYWSVFLLLIIGLSATTIVAAVELFWFKHKGRYRARYEYRGGSGPTSSGAIE